MNLQAIPEQPFRHRPSTKADSKTKAAIEKAKLDYFRISNRGLEDDIDARKMYASRAFWLVVAWLSSIFIMLFFQGFSAHGQGFFTGERLGVKFVTEQPSLFFLSDRVLITLITSTTVSVIGIFVIVMKYLFPSGKKH
ncbi:MAG: hypothetical protein JWN25_1799 [Verrucomicrobiales bacterium]|nr:hypothetical protein [Verrucomicrobiales bacterium]